MRRSGRYLVLCLLFVFSGAATAREQDVREAIVKTYTVHSFPDYYNPWSMRGPRQSTGSGCVISGRRILTNAHVVSDETFIQVRRYGESRRYRARVVSVSHDADLAVLTVDDPAFFKGVEPLELGTLPESQSEVLVYGFPLGGDTLSITKGVISRIEHQQYVHSSAYLLAGQIDAAINPGNSGGPVILDGKVVGVAMQAITKAENIGYMVPVNIVHHFLNDIKDGRYDGFPSLGVALQDMENPDMRLKYRVPPDRTGILIDRVAPHSAADGTLQVGDVLLSVDGHAIANNGTVEFRPKERTSVSFFIQQHQIGEPLRLEMLRDGKVREETVKLTHTQRDDQLIPLDQYDVLPRYYIYGGVVFCPLTKNLLKAWGPNWYNSAPKGWVGMLSNNFVRKDKDEVVVALKVLADDVNEGYHKYSNWIIEKVDGKKIRNLKELVRLTEAPSDDPYIIFSSKDKRQLVLDRKRCVEARQRILDTYRIRADRSDDLKE